MSPLNFGRSWRNFQVIWWGWRWALPPRLAVRLEHPRAPLDAVYRWCLYLGPVEIRRWAEDWRDQRARLIRERAGAR